MHDTTDFPPVAQRIRGVALVAVLAVLTALAIIASAFVAFMHMEQIVSRTNKAKMQSELLAQSALEHAFSLLRFDAEDAPGWDSLDEPWARAAKSGEKSDGWYYVRDDEGRVVGRYSLEIQDEGGKINVNTASALDPRMQNEGLGPFETMLFGPDNRALPVDLSFAKNILRYRYGRDLEPGHANVDDNLTQSLYALDEIDNDGDGLYDEEGEGIDEPQEYDPVDPKWDDRVFSSIYDVIANCASQDKVNKTALNALKRYATTRSKSHDVYYDPRSRTLRKRLNVNVANKPKFRDWYTARCV